MRGGSKPKPTALKVLAGNPGKRPLPKDEPKPSAELPEPPKALGARARAHFERLRGRLEEIGLASATHTEALELYARARVEIEGLDRELSRGGLAYEAQSGERVARTGLLTARDRAERRALEILREFGLTPSSSTRVAAVPRNDKPASRFSWRTGTSGGSAS